MIEQLLKELIDATKAQTLVTQENNDLLRTGLQLSAKPIPGKRKKVGSEVPAPEAPPELIDNPNTLVTGADPEALKVEEGDRRTLIEDLKDDPEPVVDDSDVLIDDSDVLIDDTLDLMPIRAAHRRKSASAKHLPDFTAAYKALSAKFNIAKLPELKTKGNARAFLAELEAIEIETV